MKDDPKKLKAQIRELKSRVAQLASRPPVKVDVPIVPVDLIVTVDALALASKQLRDQFEETVLQLRASFETQQRWIDNVQASIKKAKEESVKHSTVVASSLYVSTAAVRR